MNTTMNLAVAVMTASGSVWADNRISHIPSGAVTDTLEWSVVRQRTFHGNLIATADAELNRRQGVATKLRADNSWIEWHVPQSSWVDEGDLVLRLDVSVGREVRARDLIYSLLEIEPPGRVTTTWNVETERAREETKESGAEFGVSKDGPEASIKSSATTVVVARYRTTDGRVIERRIGPEEAWYLYRELGEISAQRLQVEYRAAVEGYVHFEDDVLDRKGHLGSGEPLFAIEAPLVEARLWLDTTHYKHVRPKRLGPDVATTATITKDGVVHDGVVIDIAQDVVGVQVPAAADTSAGRKESLVPYPVVEVTIEAARSLGDSLKHGSAITAMMADVSLHEPVPALSVPWDALIGDAGGGGFRAIVARAENGEWVARSVPVRVRDADDITDIVITDRGVDYVAVVDGLVDGDIVLQGGTFADGDSLGKVGEIFTVRDCRTCPVMRMIPAGEVGKSGQPAGAGHVLVGYRPLQWDAWERCVGGTGVCRLPRWLFRPSEVSEFFPPQYGRVTLWRVWRAATFEFGCWHRNWEWLARYYYRGEQHIADAALVCRSPIWKWVESQGDDWIRRPGFRFDRGPDTSPRKAGLQSPYRRYRCYFWTCGSKSEAVRESAANTELRKWIFSGIDRSQWVEEDFYAWRRGQSQEYRLLRDAGRLWDYAERCITDWGNPIRPQAGGGVIGAIVIFGMASGGALDVSCGHGLDRSEVVNLPGQGNVVLGYWIAREP